ncbi:outer membrane protein [Brucellaceae bacterium C25G]
MNIKSILLASTFAFVGMSGAMAADAIVYEEPVAVEVVPVFSWAGAYVGGQIGYGWGKSTYDFDGYRIGKAKPNGFIGGVYAGYNFDVGNNLILGIDGDVTFGNQKKKLHETYTDGTDSADIKTENKIRTTGAIRARFGYAADRFMPYIAGGVAFANVKNSLSGTITEDGDTVTGDYSRKKTMTGWTIGGGVDYAAMDNLIVRFEYRYSDYGKKNFTFTDGDESLTFRDKVKSNDIRLGVAYKF